MKEYIPTSLRNLQLKKIHYSLSIKFTNGIYYQPGIDSEQELELLEHIGTNSSVILKYDIDGSCKEIWKWRNDKWISVD